MPGIAPSIWYYLVRPKMYTLSGTLGEMVAFITGYVGGVGKCWPDAPIVLEWYDFMEWLRQKLAVGQQELFGTFVERYGNHQVALATLHRYFDEFKAEKAQGSEQAS